MSIPSAVEGVAQASREGLPFWILWLLICVIFLLLAFIFLRDKDLRRRLAAILSGGKRRVLRARLRLRLKRNHRRRDEQRRELGRLARIGNVEPRRFEPFYSDLARLDAAAAAAQSSINEHRARILAFQNAADEARRRRNDLHKRRDAGARLDVPGVRAAKREESTAKKEAKSFRKRLEDFQDEARKVEDERAGLLRALGETIDEVRLERSEFGPIFAAIDRINRNIQALIDQIEKLK